MAMMWDDVSRMMDFYIDQGIMMTMFNFRRFGGRPMIGTEIAPLQISVLKRKSIWRRVN
jgi:hypothetical protein